MIARPRRWRRRLLLVAILVGFLPGVHAGEVKVAVAANFAPTLEMLVSSFGEHDVLISQGSTGKIYAQIRLGAPFDVFLAADQERPRLLEESGLALDRFTYATGTLVLVSKDCDSVGAVLKASRRVSIANPLLAPYGAAAREAITRLGLWDETQPKIVLGENIGQAYTLYATGNVDAAVVAQAQVRATRATGFCTLPTSLHAPIRQDAVLLTDNPAALAFVQFLKNAGEQIRAAGYAAD